MTAQKRPKKGDRLRAFATVRYWIGQLNESGIKHDINIATSTKDLYLYHLVMFDEWLAGREFDVRVQTVVDGRIVRKTAQRSFEHVEELLYFGEEGNEKEVKKIISQYLADPRHRHLRRSTKVGMCTLDGTE